MNPEGREIISTSAIQWRSLSPAVAANSHGYLVVWQDARDAHSQDAKIYGVRLNFLGSNIDTEPFLIAQQITTNLRPRLPAVAINGSWPGQKLVPNTAQQLASQAPSFRVRAGVGPRLVLSDVPVGWLPEPGPDSYR
jgi:hypothetical protein